MVKETTVEETTVKEMTVEAVKEIVNVYKMVKYLKKKKNYHVYKSSVIDEKDQ